MPLCPNASAKSFPGDTVKMLIEYLSTSCSFEKEKLDKKKRKIEVKLYYSCFYIFTIS